MKRLSLIFIILGLLFTTSCGLQKEGLVVMTDQSYKASVYATNKMGIGSPDGLLWHKGKLYFADEGAEKLQHDVYNSVAGRNLPEPPESQGDGRIDVTAADLPERRINDRGRAASEDNAGQQSSKGAVRYHGHWRARSPHECDGTDADEQHDRCAGEFGEICRNIAAHRLRTDNTPRTCHPKRV